LEPAFEHAVERQGAVHGRYPFKCAEGEPFANKGGTTMLGPLADAGFFVCVFLDFKNFT